MLKNISSTLELSTECEVVCAFIISHLESSLEFLVTAVTRKLDIVLACHH